MTLGYPAPAARQEVVVYKNLGPEARDLVTKAALPPRTRRFVLASDSLDRDGDVVMPSGVRFNDYLKNPVMLWSHQLAIPPIGKCVRLDLVAGGRALVGDYEFATTKLAGELYELYAGGFLNMVSVGFRPVVSGLPDHALLKARPELYNGCKRVISACTLFEVSAVGIGSNPDALQVSVTKGLTVPAELLPKPVPRQVARVSIPVRVNSVPNPRLLEQTLRARFAGKDFQQKLGAIVAKAFVDVIGK